MLKIGNCNLKNNIILAPMAGVSTSSYRNICLEHHAGLVCTEMISDKGLAYENAKTLQMIKIKENEHPISMQIFGSDFQSITSSAKQMIKLSPIDILDVNMGCPVQKVVKSGAGSALMKTPQKIYDIVKSLKENIDIPVTIKIRAGWDSNSINCDQVSHLACLAGVDAITIHGRTRSQLYTGVSNLEYIQKVKEVSTVPVIGNGDIKDIESAIKMFATGVDGIMVGRAAMGNPFIFNQLDVYFNEGRLLNPPTKQEVIFTLLDHAQRLISDKGEHLAIIEMRSHAGWYLRLIPRSKQYKNAIVSIKTYDELKKICQAILQND